MAFFAAVLMASLVGSLHCAGMCGPLVAFAVGDAGSRTWSARAALHAAYHGGRLVTYALAGALCGSIGAAMDLGAARVGMYHAAELSAGIVMVAAGVAAVLRYSGARLPLLPLPGRLRGLIVAGQRAAFALRPWPRALTMGLLTALLPCGWLYLFALAAASAGSPLRATVVMTAFWLGTLPILVTLGIGVQTLTGALGRRIPLVTAVLIVALGVFTLVRRTAATVEAPRPSGAMPAAGTVQQVQALGDTTPSCCRHHGD
jgi:sulfite exporter TauE/SafE